ncbi:MAG TPA: pilus assembly protein N-terminal domain-containing protein, partial [Terriglobales bacterium]|nr:pilus assembly protein N-terminal domain-containing protein [Terriglobales bacterium]
MRFRVTLVAGWILLAIVGVGTAAAQAAAEAAGVQAAGQTAAQGAQNAGQAAGQAVGQAAGQQTAPAPAVPQMSQNPSSPPAAPPAAAQQGPSVGTEQQGPAPLRVMVGKSLLINTTERLKRVSVTDPSVADALVVTPTQILVHGRAPGEVSLLIWDEAERSRSFDLRVDVDVTAAAEEIHKIFPDEQIDVSPSRAAIVLSGHVSTEDVAKRAGLIAEAYSKNVVNVLTFGPVGAQEVELAVKFAEVDRTALLQYGINIFSTGATNTVGTIGTQQFGGFGSQNISDVFPVGHPRPPFQSTETINDVLNIFLFRPDIHL